MGAHLWTKYSQSRRQRQILEGINAITIGFIAASAYLLTVSASKTWKHTALALIAAAAATAFKSLNPLWLIAGGVVVGCIW